MLQPRHCLPGRQPNTTDCAAARQLVPVAHISRRPPALAAVRSYQNSSVLAQTPSAPASSGQGGHATIRTGPSTASLQRHRGVCNPTAQPHTAATSAPVPNSAGTAIFEYLVLFQQREDCSQDAAVAALEALWGLQFSLPGCVCAFGGRVNASLSHQPGASHALHMRFASQAQANSFRQHPAVREAFRSEFAPVADNIVELLFEAVVDQDLFGIFRRGGEWETGTEHLLLLKDVAKAGDATDFVSRLGHLALDGQSQGQQACWGTVLQHHLQDGATADRALMVRFPTLQQLSWFQESAPYQALLASDDCVPVSLLAAITFELLPAEKQSSKPPPLDVRDV